MTDVVVLFESRRVFAWWSTHEKLDRVGQTVQGVSVIHNIDDVVIPRACLTLTCSYSVAKSAGPIQRFNEMSCTWVYCVDMRSKLSLELSGYEASMLSYRSFSYLRKVIILIVQLCPISARFSSPDFFFRIVVLPVKRFERVRLFVVGDNGSCQTCGGNFA